MIDPPPANFAEWQPTRWYAVTAPDGTLWCETSDKIEALNSMRARRHPAPTVATVRRGMAPRRHNRGGAMSEAHRTWTSA